MLLLQYVLFKHKFKFIFNPTVVSYYCIKSSQNIKDKPMKNKTLLFLATVIAMTAVSMADTIKDQKSIWSFIEYTSKDSGIRLASVEYEKSVEINGTGWSAYPLVLTIDTVKGSAKIHRVIFANGNLVTDNIYNADTNQSLGVLLSQTVENSEYTQERHLAGNINAEHKILIFSDPAEPYSHVILPRILEVVKNNPENFSLYLVHSPFGKVRPASVTLSKALVVAHQKGIADSVSKIYTGRYNPFSDENRTLEEISMQTGIKLTYEEINTPEVLNAIKNEKTTMEKYYVESTPTIFLDGKKIKDYIKVMRMAEKIK